MKNIQSKLYTTLLFLFVSLIALAQPGDTGDGVDGLEGNDAPAPIGDYVWLLALVGIVFVFVAFRAINKKQIHS